MQFSKVAKKWDEIEGTGGRIGMAGIFADLLADSKKAEIKPLVYLSTGVLLPPFEGLELGIGEKLAEDAIGIVSGHDKKTLGKKFKEFGDLGLVAQWAMEKKKQMALSSGELDLAGVYKSLVNLAKMSGKGSQDGKIKVIAELLNSSSGVEAKYIIRFCVGKMRLGIAEPTMLDALALIKIPKVKEEINGIRKKGERKLFRIKLKGKADEDALESDATLQLRFECGEEEIIELQGGEIALAYGKEELEGLKLIKIKKEKEGIYYAQLQGFKKAVRLPIERAYNLCSDLGLICEFALFDYEKIKNFKLAVFSPIRPALAERLADAEAIIEKLGPCAAEGKYDGFRLQVHKDGERVELYSRKLERVTNAFPEIVEAAKKIKAKRAIFEGEALAYSIKEKKYFSFQVTIQRKRKYGIEKMMEEFPLKLFAFDVMYLDGVDWTGQPYERRREELEKIVQGIELIEPTELKMVKNSGELENFFKRCIADGLEGIIAKDLGSPYVAGAREFAWIKLKKSYGSMADTLDTVIVGYYLGEGQRTDFGLGGLLVAVRNEESGMLETVARIGSGFSEEEMEGLAKTLGELKMKKKPAHLSAKVEPDFWVEPKIVATVSADEISVSNQHTCGMAGDKGYALRFPRLIQIREDKGVDEITTTSEVENMFRMQKQKGK